ncbi:acyl-CoA synthetase [Vineibacter terrae]|uniref:acyl-CoA synthetase n=1 Tax=Vineibacter terrae TaxID=2586908 RepID=UPI002E2F3481|nr:acyl-CoA synthetase [Vineibacter terrae]HEX2889363.1 acyl-CoA synthetase [Vineibacter terrae]
MAAWILAGDRRRPHDEVMREAERAAAGFAAHGIGPGDVVAVCLRNDFAFLTASAGASLIGAYVTPVNWHNSADEAGYVFVNSGAKAIVIHADLHRRMADAIPAGVLTLVVETPDAIVAAYGLAPQSAVLPAGVTGWTDWLARHAPRQGGRVAALGSMIYTSGTTGRPKGVRRAPTSEAQAEAAERNAAVIFGLGHADGPSAITCLLAGPLYHSTPNAFSLRFFAMGARLIIEPRFDAETLLRRIEQERVTHLLAVPTMFVRLLRLPAEVRARYDLSSLRFVMHGAAPCPVHVKRAMIDWWGPIIHEHYGGTETGAVTYCNSQEWLAHPGTVGRALPSCDVRIIAEDGSDVAAGGTGEVICRNRNFPDFTYHGDDDKRRRADRQGLVTLGDVGYLDQDGYLYLCGRANDMVISGGVNIYPAEIEAELHKMAGVADCAVFGIPDDEYGEKLCAVVQPIPGAVLTAAAVQAHLRERVAGYKVPRQVEFRAELPREDSGKIFKRKLRDPYWEGAGRRI